MGATTGLTWGEVVRVNVPAYNDYYSRDIPNQVIADYYSEAW